jgi:hypothetical protein
VAWCQGSGVFDEWSYQSNLLPTDDIIKDLTKGDSVQTSVWPFGSFECYLFENVPPLATGTSDAVSTDNNLFGENVNRANSWNFSAHGVLYDAAGEDYIFQHNTHCTWKDYSDFSTARCHNKIRLR